ncbi:hypothetical protein SHIRM173S_11744 [Streptomyces hirsutus]
MAKPLLGREGAGVTIHPPGSTPAVRDEPCCYQQLAPLPDFDGNHVVLGAWTVGDESAGLGIRESSGLITDEYARSSARDPLGPRTAPGPRTGRALVRTPGPR